jgi:undecaprenyl-diphosphatase
VAIAAAATWHRDAPLNSELRLERFLYAGTGRELSFALARDVAPVVAVIVLAMIAGWAWGERRWRVLPACVAPLLAVSAVEILLKPLVHRQNASDALQFPSGHVTAAASITTLVLVAVVPNLRLPWTRAVVAAASVTGCAFATVGVIASGMHWAVDALAGLPTGLGVALAWCWVVDWVADRRSDHGLLRRS